MSNGLNVDQCSLHVRISSLETNKGVTLLKTQPLIFGRTCFLLFTALSIFFFFPTTWLKCRTKKQVLENKGIFCFRAKCVKIINYNKQQQKKSTIILNKRDLICFWAFCFFFLNIRDYDATVKNYILEWKALIRSDWPNYSLYYLEKMSMSTWCWTF